MANYKALVINRKVLTWFFMLAIVILLAANIALRFGPTVNGSSVVALVQNPVVLAVVGAVLTFLVLERWKKLENDISDISKSQTEALSQIRTDAKSLTLEQTEAATLAAQSIESRVSKLIDEHPWIADITENEFYPDASSCRIVLRTARQLVEQGKITLAYEYLFFWAKADGAKGFLEGTAEDFHELAQFCEIALDDEYLAFLVMREGYKHAADRISLLPDFVRISIRKGFLMETVRAVSELRGLISPSWFRRTFGIVRREVKPQRATLSMRGFLALAVYEAATGREERVGPLLSRATEFAKATRRIVEVTLTKAEIFIIRGEYDAAEREIADVSKEGSSDSDLLDLLSIERSLGSVERTQAITVLLQARNSRAASVPVVAAHSVEVSEAVLSTKTRDAAESQEYVATVAVSTPLDLHSPLPSIVETAAEKLKP